MAWRPSVSRVWGASPTLENRVLHQLSGHYLDHHDGKPYKPLPLSVGHSTKGEVATYDHGATHIETPREYIWSAYAPHEAHTVTRALGCFRGKDDLKLRSVHKAPTGYHKPLGHRKHTMCRQRPCRLWGLPASRRTQRSPRAWRTCQACCPRRRC